MFSTEKNRTEVDSFMVPLWKTHSTSGRHKVSKLMMCWRQLAESFFEQQIAADIITTYYNNHNHELRFMECSIVMPSSRAVGIDPRA